MPNNENVLIVSPLQDYPTHSSAEVILRTKEYAEKKGYNVSTLYGLMANRFFLEQFVKANDPVFVFYGGHGLEDRWIANGMSILDEKNAKVMKERIVVANPVCRSLRKLGPIVVMNGAYAYIGSTRDVWIIPNIEGETCYRDQFMRIWLNVYKDLLDGKTVEDTVIHYKAESERLAMSWVNRKYPHAKESARFLLMNSEIFGYSGYPMVKVSPPGEEKINIINYGIIGAVTTSVVAGAGAAYLLYNILKED